MMCRDETRDPGLFQDLLFRVDSSKAECFLEGVTNSGAQPFPRQTEADKLWQKNPLLGVTNIRTAKESIND